MDYVIVQADTAEELESEVGEKLANGWYPQGGVVPIVTGETARGDVFRVYSQALVRPTEPQDWNYLGVPQPGPEQ